MNRVILIGNLTTDPEYKQTQNGVSTCRFTVAVDRPQSKDKPKEADFINCQAWRGTADFVEKYFTKGKPIVVEGSMRNNNYTDKNGVQRYEMYALVDNVSFTPSGGNGGGSSGGGNTSTGSTSILESATESLVKSIKSLF